MRYKSRMSFVITTSVLYWKSFLMQQRKKRRSIRLGRKTQNCLCWWVCCCSVAQLCPTLCNSMGCSTPGSPGFYHLQSLLKLMSSDLVMPSNHLILCRPLLLLPSIFPSISVFSNESVLCIGWSGMGTNVITPWLALSLIHHHQH